VQRLLVLLLERLGHEVTVLEEERPPERIDLLVLEPASEPGLEGARLLRDAHPGLPILCVSVLPDDARHLELGPLAYLAKPFSLDELRDSVERALGLCPCRG